MRPDRAKWKEVWSRSRNLDKSIHHVKIRVSVPVDSDEKGGFKSHGEFGRVEIQSYVVGPRGGGGPAGWFGLSKSEWDEINFQIDTVNKETADKLMNASE